MRTIFDQIPQVKIRATPLYFKLSTEGHMGTTRHFELNTEALIECGSPYINLVEAGRHLDGEVLQELVEQSVEHLVTSYLICLLFVVREIKNAQPGSLTALGLVRAEYGPMAALRMKQKSATANKESEVETRSLFSLSRATAV